MQLLQNISLLPYNTFGLDVSAEYFLELKDPTLLPDISNDTAIPQNKHILGGGSNILLTQPIKGIVIHNCIKGISTIKETDSHIWLQISAGELWHEFVMHTIGQGLTGIENLALIPGTVGASPIQNIGAYGVEVKEVIDAVTCWHWEQKVFITLNNAECQFGYRDSIFKRELKDKVFVSSVVFKLHKQAAYRTSYGAINEELTKMQVPLSTAAIANAVINIRSSKLPDPKKIGNAGSFFKNPTISTEHFELLQTNYPSIPSYPVNDTTVKIPAGWLIEQCGWKGYRKGDAGVHEKQALVLVNYQHASGAEIWQLSTDILTSIKERFGILLEREVQVW
ncbi:MAG: UDP-N-acetylmuramate dehydrogenase [Bacteroidota bacterium]